MKKIILIFLISFVVYSCSKSGDSSSPSVVVKLSGCDSIKQGLLKSTSDTVRLASCLPLSANDSMRLGLLKIGQPYQGGVIAYFLVPGDPGYDANIKHGLIAATTDQSERIRWFNGAYVNTDAIGTSIGSGFTNTNKIINVQGATITSYAAGLARSYNGGGYNDWFLPSKDELDKLRINIITIGGFSNNNFYWSSTQINKSSAWASYFNNVNFSFSGGGDGSEGTQRVRAIRAF